ncbi:MAG: A/G-specific adenine glycosylase [Candidatus Uhrbacteria bacterium]|nr:A/G-specific adenine glycosylase [Candidatus Uhrbacteria bacterium]
MQSSIPAFQRTILNWFKKNGRHDLPWRPPALKARRDDTYDPYRVLVSEVMLQQTQVDRVKEKYMEFLRHFATPKKLSEASPAEVLAVWKGLGYNRRALYLKRAAEKIVIDYKGRFPRDVSEIEKLPGVGHYTARAVAVFAFNQPQAFIETNIRRVFIHFFFAGKSGIADSQLFPLIEKAFYYENPRLWYSALMDYGALALSGIPNPNRQSRHYTKQSRFEGSRRYARAKILDFLLKNKAATEHVMRQYFLTDPHLELYSSDSEIKSILADLSKEGFLAKKSRGWSLIVSG